MNERSDQLSSDLASLRIQRGENPDRPRPLRWALVAIVLLSAGVAGYVLGVPYVEAKVFKTPAAFSEISLVSPAEASTELTDTGYVMPLVITHAGGKVLGRAARALVKEGELVKAGQVLFLLEDSDQRTALGTADARFQAARAGAELARAKATVTVRVRFVDSADGVLPDMAGRVGFSPRHSMRRRSRKSPSWWRRGAR